MRRLNANEYRENLRRIQYLNPAIDSAPKLFTERTPAQIKALKANIARKKSILDIV